MSRAPQLLLAYATTRRIRLAAVDAPGIAREILRADDIPHADKSDQYVVWRALKRAEFHFKADALADHAHPFTYCMENIAPKANVSDPEAFCANLVHEATGQWPAEYSK